MPLRRQDFEIGKVLQWPIFDRNHNLLLKQGQVIRSDRQLETLLQLGLYRDGHWRPAKVTRPVEIEEEDDDPVESADKTVYEPFGNVPFKLGDVLQMRPTGEEKAPYFVKLYGLNDKGSLILSAPYVNGSLVLVREGQPFRFRAFLGKSIYAFDATAIKSHLTPYPYLHVGIPSKVQVINVRQASRITVNLVSSIETIGEFGVEKMACLIGDLSIHGARIKMSRLLCQIGQEVTLSFKLNVMETDHYIVQPAVVRNIQVSDEEKQAVHMGLQFHETDMQRKLILQNFLYQHVLGQS